MGKNKVKEPVKRMLRKNYMNACNQYLAELLNTWELSASEGFWIGDEVGGVYDDGDGWVTISMKEIIFCVENEVTIETFHEWQEYCVRAHAYGFAMPNLKSWVTGCPRVETAVFDKLDGVRADLQKAIDEEMLLVGGLRNR